MSPVIPWVAPLGADDVRAIVREEQERQSREPSPDVTLTVAEADA